MAFASSAPADTASERIAAGASHPSSIVKPPPAVRRSAKVVYFIASHVHPEQVVRMVRALRQGGDDSRVLIHHDYRASHLEPSSVERFGNVDLMLPPSPVRYGGFESCAMILRAMRWLVERRDFDWMVYLSGQDYPLRPARQIQESLALETCDGFLDAVPVDEAEWFLGIERYLYQYCNLPLAAGGGRLRNFLAHRSRALRHRGNRMPRFHVPTDRWGKSKVGMLPLHGPFSGNFKCYVGSAWWTLSRRAIEYVIGYAARHQALAQHYRRVLFAPNESYFLTILMNEPRLQIKPRDNRRFVRWTLPETGHPDLLREHDFEQMVRSGCDFARKIDGRVDSAVIDRIDRHIGVDA